MLLGMYRMKMYDHFLSAIVSCLLNQPVQLLQKRVSNIFHLQWREFLSSHDGTHVYKYHRQVYGRQVLCLLPHVVRRSNKLTSYGISTVN